MVYFPEIEKVNQSKNENKFLCKPGAFQFTVHKKNEEGPNQLSSDRRLKIFFDKKALHEF